MKRNKVIKRVVSCILLLTMLVPVIPLNSQSVTSLEDGRYTISLRLWHATNDEASMGDAGVTKTGTLVVKDGEATLQIELQSLNVGGSTGYLSELNSMKDIVYNSYQYPETYTKVASKVLSVYDVVDSYNADTSTDVNCRGVAYPKKVAIWVTLGEEYTWVQMYIPIMGAMGFGEQIARLKLDYSSVKQMEPISSTDLQELFEEAGAFDSSKYTESSYAVLSEKMQEASQVLAAETAEQDAIEEAYYTLLDAIGALTAVEVEETPSTDSGSDEAEEEESSSLDKDSLANGKYQVTVGLWHATSNKESMGNAALDGTALLEVKNGSYTMTVATHEMTIGTITACLASLQIQQQDGSYTYAKITENNNSDNQPSAFQFTLPSTEEYIPVKIDPQVEIMGDEPLDARLKISWSTLKAVSGDTTISGGNQGNSSNMGTSAVKLTDSATGIMVSAEANVLEEGVSLKVTSYASGTIYQNAASVLADIGEDFQLYKIQIVNKSGKAVTPNGLVTISIPVPSSYRTDSLGTCRINAGSAMTRISGSIASGAVTFSTRELGLYAVYQSSDSSSLEASDSTASNGTSASGTGSSGSTIDLETEAGETQEEASADSIANAESTELLSEQSETVFSDTQEVSDETATTLDKMKLAVAIVTATTVTIIVLAVFAGLTGYIVYKKLREESDT